MDGKENVIEWINGDKTVTCTFSQKRFINRLRRMIEKRPPCGEILTENADGSILAKIPLCAVHIYLIASKNAPPCGDDNDAEEQL